MSLCLILLWPRIKIRLLSDYFFTNMCLGICICHDVFVVSCEICIRKDL